VGHGKHCARRLGAEPSPVAHGKPRSRELGVDDRVKLVPQNVRRVVVGSLRPSVLAMSESVSERLS
jgi:hypothetical protein